MKLKLFIKYFLFLYILAISSFEYFHRVTQPALYLLFPIVSVIFIYYKEKFDYRVFYVILPFFLAFLLQTLLNNTPISFAFSLIIRYITIYFVAKIIGKDIVKIFINTIKIISIISIVLYVVQYVPSLNNFMLSICRNFTNLGSDPTIVIDRPNFIIYTIQDKGLIEGFFRNSGPFWESGLYVVFLNIALLLNTFDKKSIFNKINLLFIINIISAISTTGIIVLLMNIAFFTLTIKTVSLQYRVIVFSLLLISIPTISSLSFMSDKIQTQYDQSDLSYSRFGAVVVHWKIMKDYPFAGLPYDNNKTYKTYSDFISPNGITEIFIRYGIPAGIIYYILLYKSCVTIMNYLGYKKRGYFMFLILVTLLFSQAMGNRPIYLLFLFFPILPVFKRTELLRAQSIKKLMNKRASLKNVIK